MFPPPTCVALIRYARVATGLQDVRHHDGERNRYRFLRVCNRRPVCGRDIPYIVVGEYSWYDVHYYGPCCGQRLSTLIAFGCWEFSATTPSHPLHSIPNMCGRRTSDSGNRTHRHLALLWFVLSEVLSYSSSLAGL